MALALPISDHAPDQGGGLSLPRRQPPRAFPMTAMADMLFQLLIFFMLSANLASFAMLDFRTGQLAGNPATETTGPDTSAAPAMDARITAVWTLAPDRLIASGQQFGLNQLPELADALTEMGTSQLLIVLRPDVPVKDVIAVLEMLHIRGITAVQIADGGKAE